ncbi:NAD(P)-dependent oxidoreductase [Myxococcota bacterium]|nr:NAD(P)-dependent oxidoreductase [Myxococcota bacterium]
MIYILGGEGFVGSAFVRHCQSRGLEFTTVTRGNYDSLVGTSCDVFINSNGNSSKPRAREDPLWDFDANVRSVRQTLLDFRVALYVHVSSCDVYADCSSPETTREDQPLDPAGQTPYGFHKFLAEQCVRHEAPRWLITRMGGFVGPGLKKNAVYDVLNGGPLWLDPASELQFLHTDTAADLVMDLVANRVEGTEVNVCGSGVVSLREVMAWAGTDVPVQPDSPRVRYQVSVDKLSQMLSVPETRKTVQQFIEDQQEAEISSAPHARGTGC